MMSDECNDKKRVPCSPGRGIREGAGRGEKDEAG